MRVSVLVLVLVVPPSMVCSVCWTYVGSFSGVCNEVVGVCVVMLCCVVCSASRFTLIAIVYCVWSIAFGSIQLSSSACSLTMYCPV